MPDVTSPLMDYFDSLLGTASPDVDTVTLHKRRQLDDLLAQAVAPFDDSSAKVVTQVVETVAAGYALIPLWLPGSRPSKAQALTNMFELLDLARQLPMGRLHSALLAACKVPEPVDNEC
tara:strand:+ start:1720 stop:2076 length:357 start_codon:yes stop_codon:yes gene_type:complete